MPYLKSYIIMATLQTILQMVRFVRSAKIKKNQTIGFLHIHLFGRKVGRCLVDVLSLLLILLESYYGV